MGAKRRRLLVYLRLTFALCVLASVSVAAIARADTATWTGSDGSSWSSPGSWNPNAVPCNGLVTDYDVIIPSGVGIYPVADLACTIDSVSLADDATLSFGTNTLSASSCTLSGILSGVGGNFSCPSSATFVGGRVRISASNGSNLSIGATSYSSTGLPSSTALFTSSGASSVLSLGVTTLDAGFDDNTSGASQHYAYANGGTINLSGLVSTVAPLRAEDYLRFIADSTARSCFPTCSSVSSANAGHTRFEIAGSSSRSPPRLCRQDRLRPSTAAADLHRGRRAHQLLLRWLPQTGRCLRPRTPVFS
jgi:hypothetical protein